jgi:EAL domain-containing protein (putative c-di-GMP-specific phosphodiesterase class I)
MSRCICQSAVRPLALVFGRLADENEEIGEMVRRFDLEWHPDLNTARVDVGPGTAFAGPAEVSELVSGIVGAEQAGQVRATWLDTRPLAEQAGTLLRAESLDAFAPRRDSPLAGILDERRIETWFQPILDRDGAVWGHECLMRAHDAAGNLINPGQMIEWAQQENLLFMLDRVCRETHIHNADAAGFPDHHKFLINFLPSVIYKPEFCLRTTVNALEQTHLSASRIIFEVVETEQVRNHDHLREILEFYRNAGFGVALDDLAAGYSGLTMLAELQPDLVKIDRHLVTRAVESTSHAEICQSVIDLGRRRGRPVLAEGVETEAEHTCMRDMGVDLFQGFLFGRPAPVRQ